ncbi:hypothetical protein BN2476_300045 [Paraburkholderia piptadeniae]|uniref:Uncharacterized protein n=1 Tax=Paraburkholderia piptadeniae TaxID=1701573 RepID=A0A1N7S281_9BURK|nr:hypothetical protein BN2476_300045 [Paraburkholderia piptadeniae]
MARHQVTDHAGGRAHFGEVAHPFAMSAVERGAFLIPVAGASQAVCGALCVQLSLHKFRERRQCFRRV